MNVSFLDKQLLILSRLPEIQYHPQMSVMVCEIQVTGRCAGTSYHVQYGVHVVNVHLHLGSGEAAILHQVDHIAQIRNVSCEIIHYFFIRVLFEYVKWQTPTPPGSRKESSRLKIPHPLATGIC